MRNISVFGDCEVQGITINQYQASFNPQCFNSPGKANDGFQPNAKARNRQQRHDATAMSVWGIIASMHGARCRLNRVVCFTGVSL